MISEQSTVTFLWRCSRCPAVYDGEGVSLLLDDGTSRACSCGGSLTEDVGPAPSPGQYPRPGQRAPRPRSRTGSVRSLHGVPR